MGVPHARCNQDKSILPVVLIVEGSRVIRSELKRSIESSFELAVEAVSTYQEARKILEEQRRNIFLSIVSLRLADAKDGEIVDLISSMAVPCIVFTSDMDESTRSQMLSKKIIDYVVKDAHAVSNILKYIRRLNRNRKIKVLVVEDSESFRFHICSLLYRQMFQVVDVPDGESAIAMIEADDDIKLVVTDYEMPGINGVQLTNTIRGRFNKDDMPIIGISSSDAPMLTARFLKSGANDYIPKPFEAEEFYCRIDHNVETMEQIRALREANRIKNQFLGMAVHDLRSPINGINGLSEMLLKDMCGELNDEQRDLIEFIHSANLHMNSMVNDLLDISVIESGKLNLIKSEADLGEVVEKRVRIHSVGAKGKTLTLVPHLKKIAMLVFDSRRVGQVLDNLLTNAIKFSPTGQSIEVTLDEQDGFAVVGIHDHGQGIPPGEEGLLFQSFKKTSVQPTAGESSTGLGLPIVKKIVEAHGGSVWVESEFGKGANFYFSLPLS